MTRNSDKRIRLADYIFDDMDPGERERIEKEIREDPEISESHDLNVKVKDYLKAKIRLEEMRSDPGLDEAEKLADQADDNQEVIREPEGNKSTGRSWVRGRRLIFTAAIAASVAALVLVGIYRPFTTSERLFRDYYEPLDASGYSQRGEVNALYQDLSEGINSYANGNFNEAKLIFDRLGSVYRDQPEVQFFRGLTYIGLKQYQYAKVTLEDYIYNNSRYLPEAIWYLSLCCLKTGDLKEAEDLLIRMNAYEGMYKKDAQALWRKLQRIR